jgi:hypothetical protein
LWKAKKTTETGVATVLTQCFCFFNKITGDFFYSLFYFLVLKIANSLEKSNGVLFVCRKMRITSDQKRSTTKSNDRRKYFFLLTCCHIFKIISFFFCFWLFLVENFPLHMFTGRGKLILILSRLIAAIAI